MNQGICEGCRRYDNSDGKWLCARIINKAMSRVVPGYVVYEKDYYYPMSENSLPPEWCDFMLEQTVAEKEDQIQASKPEEGYMSIKAVEKYQKISHRGHPNDGGVFGFEFKD